MNFQLVLTGPMFRCQRRPEAPLLVSTVFFLDQLQDLPALFHRPGTVRFPPRVAVLQGRGPACLVALPQTFGLAIADSQ
jgi:hypothetical protein